MRQGQQNRRGRGRNNNRKGGHHNPLSRSFESNGPEQKIRGTPASIAEKYISLARDAQAAGDPVLAENYLQHAEHYNRIIMAYRDQFNQPGEGGTNGGGIARMRPGEMGESYDDLGDDGDFGDDGGFPQPFVPHGGHQQQPRPQEGRQPGGEHGRPERHDRPDRPDRPERQDRPFRRDQGRPRYGERQGFVDRERDRQPDTRHEMHERAPEQVAEAVGEPRAEPRPEPRGEPRRRGDRFQQPHEQPEFLRRPVRRTRSETAENGSKSEPTGE